MNGNSDSDSSQDLLSTLSSLTSLGAGTDTASTDVVKSVDKSSDSDISQAFAQASDMSSNTALHLEDEIKGVFAGMDNLGEVILNKIASRDSTGEINRSVANLDIQSDILRSIASHDRSDEISEYNSYNASRIASYKNAGGSTSVFGDFKL